jgi:hypothetical protein
MTETIPTARMIALSDVRQVNGYRRTRFTGYDHPCRRKGMEDKRYDDHVPDRLSGPSKIDNVLKEVRNGTAK